MIFYEGFEKKNIKEIESRSRAWESNKEAKLHELGTAIVDMEKLDIDQELDNHKILSSIKDQVAKKSNLESDQKRLTNSANRSKAKLEELQMISLT